MLTHYYTIEKPATAEFKDRGSLFIAYAFPIQTVDEFKKQLKKLREEHPKAAHHCSAYRLGADGSQFRASDDGEPAGSAGKPILGQIDGKQLSNIAVIVVRYFGGTLLGVPGLINAYKTVTSLALQLTPIIQKPVLYHYALQFDYTMMNEVMLTIKRFECVIFENELQLFCHMKIGIPALVHEACIQKFKDMHTVDIASV